MKSALLLLASSFLFLDTAAQTALVRTEWTPAVSEAFAVVYLTRNNCLILADMTGIEALRTIQAPVTIVENRPCDTAAYYAVYPDQDVYPVIDREQFALCGEVLDVFDNILIIKGSAENIHYNAPVSVKLAAISFEPVEVPEKVSRTIIRKSVRPEDPHIKEMIASVRPDSCARLLRDLCGMFNRNARNTQWNKGTLVPYLERKFREYGCDTVYQVPVSTYDAPAVVGIKKGKKNPSLKEFCLIGAHPDNIRTDDPRGTLRHQGAYDNGCGTVAFLEVARVLQSYDFENSIMYAGFNCEEFGLAGSKALVNQFKRDGCKIIGGAITFDMLGIGPGTSPYISYSVYEGNQGAKAFADNIRAVCQTYSVQCNVTTTTNSDIPTDTKNFWQNGYVAAFGRGGRGGGSFHTAADSITSIFDSTWLARAVTPGVAVIAEYAVPVGPSAIHKSGKAMTTTPVNVRVSHSGSVFSITISGMRAISGNQVSLYTVSGKLLKNITLHKREDNVYTGIADAGTGSNVFFLCGETDRGAFQKKIIVKK